MKKYIEVLLKDERPDKSGDYFFVLSYGKADTDTNALMQFNGVDSYEDFIATDYEHDELLKIFPETRWLKEVKQ